MTIIQKAIMANIYYDDADVPLTVPLLKMIMKRSWTERDGNVTRPLIVQAMEGMSPFTILYLDGDQVALLNDKEELINSASLVSVNDLRAQQKKMKISVPVDATEFFTMIKRYANLIYAVFSETCTLFKLMREVVRALQAYSREARKRMMLSADSEVLCATVFLRRQWHIT